MAKRGKPLRYETVEAFDAAIDEYFKKCEGEYLKDEKGKLIRDKNGIPIKTGERPPTMTGLALHLGFTSRQAFLNYKYRSEYFDSYSRARARCEDYAESRLYDIDGEPSLRFSTIQQFPSASLRMM